MKDKWKIVFGIGILFVLLSGKDHMNSSDSSFMKDVREQIYFSKGVSIIITDQMFDPPYKDDPERMLHSFEREKHYQVVRFYTDNGKRKLKIRRDGNEKTISLESIRYPTKLLFSSTKCFVHTDSIHENNM